MKFLDKDYLFNMVGNHVLSEKRIRVQILDIPNKDVDLWELKHEDLLLNVLSGECSVKTETEEQDMQTGDQMYLHQGEKFSVKSKDQTPATIQYIWFPGISH